MTRNEVLERLCLLQFEVANHLGEWHNPADCFCNKSPPVENYQNAGKAVEFIERVVRNAIRPSHE
jgi:hypothetical protein